MKTRETRAIPIHLIHMPFGTPEEREEAEKMIAEADRLGMSLATYMRGGVPMTEEEKESFLRSSAAHQRIEHPDGCQY